MKTLIGILFAFTLMTATSCRVVSIRTSNKEPIGWHKNRNNPHHPQTTNPGHTKPKPPGHAKPKSKGR